MGSETGVGVPLTGFLSDIKKGYCPNCGEKITIYNYYYFCKHCGFQIDRVEVEEEFAA